MADFNIEDLIKDLSPELQEKAKDCNSLEELQTLAAENDIELSEEALEMVAGGTPCAEKCEGTDTFHQADYIEWLQFVPGNGVDKFIFMRNGVSIDFMIWSKCKLCGKEFYDLVSGTTMYSIERGTYAAYRYAYKANLVPRNLGK